MTPDSTLPIHFFTIVLNGEPFIRYHERMLSQLPISWHWHIVEGVAALKHDTAWSVAIGGRITDDIHRRGRSKDGTSEYLDDLALRFPDNITLYRKPPDEFWDGKREMVNAPLGQIKSGCLLWQLDSDEIWTAGQIMAVHQMFINNPDRAAAWFWCWYFVGPEKVISTRHGYGDNPQQEWLRTWRFRPNDYWAAHEPPILIRNLEGHSESIDVSKIAPFTHDEMEAVGAVFQHFAYATEAQLSFKEKYYGYKNALAHWTKLQHQTRRGYLRDYFAWVTDNTMFDNVKTFHVDPIVKFDKATKGWVFSNRGLKMATVNDDSIRRPRILNANTIRRPRDILRGILRRLRNAMRAFRVNC
jgi:hypothetical protein